MYAVRPTAEGFRLENTASIYSNKDDTDKSEEQAKHQLGKSWPPEQRAEKTANIGRLKQ